MLPPGANGGAQVARAEDVRRSSLSSSVSGHSRDDETRTIVGMKYQAFAAGLAGLALSWFVLPAPSVAAVRVVSRSDPSLPHDTGARRSVLSGYRSSISADGRYVAFSGWAPDLVPNAYLPGYEVFLLDRQTVTSRLSPVR